MCCSACASVSPPCSTCRGSARRRPTTGLLWELEAIAAVIVGGTALRGGAGSITGTVVGAVLLSVISNILNLTNIISVYLNAAVQGFVIIVVAFMQRRRP
jgi:ribose transport system permease protein